MLFFCVIAVLHHVGGISGADPELFQRGVGVRRKILKEKCLLIHVSTRVHIKTRQTFNRIVFYLLLCFMTHLFLKFELDPPMHFI